METSFCSHPNTNKVVATIFGTWHDSWAVVACAKCCCDMIISSWIRAKWNFHHIWIVMEKSLVKWVPAPLWKTTIVGRGEVGFYLHQSQLSPVGGHELLRHFKEMNSRNDFQFVIPPFFMFFIDASPKSWLYLHAGTFSYQLGGWQCGYIMIPISCSLWIFCFPWYYHENHYKANLV